MKTEACFIFDPARGKPRPERSLFLCRLPLLQPSPLRQLLGETKHDMFLLASFYCHLFFRSISLFGRSIGGSLANLSGTIQYRLETSREAKPETTRRIVQEAGQGPGGAMAVDDEGATAAAVGGDGTGATTAGTAASTAPKAAQLPASAGTNGQVFSAATSNTVRRTVQPKLLFFLYEAHSIRLAVPFLPSQQSGSEASG